MGALGKLAEMVHGHAEPVEEYSSIEEVIPTQVAIQSVEEVTPIEPLVIPRPRQTIINDIIAPWEIPTLGEAGDRAHQATSRELPASTTHSHESDAESVPKVRHIDVLPIYF